MSEMSESALYGAASESLMLFAQNAHRRPACITCKSGRPRATSGRCSPRTTTPPRGCSTTPGFPFCWSEIRLLVGDSAANVVYGYDTTVPITIDELIPLVRGVVRGAPEALVVADLPFGSYEGGAAQALASATRFMKEAGAHAVKLEGGERVAEQIATLTAAGIPVVAHIGFTPQSVNGLGGYRVQGRDDAAAQLIHDAIAVQEAGAIAVVMEMVPAELATQITGKLTIPTVGIGAGRECDAQVLVWQDMAGMTSGKTAKFVKQFGQVGAELRKAAEQYADEVARGVFPAPEHSY